MGMLGVRLGLAYAFKREGGPPEPPDDTGTFIWLMQPAIDWIQARFKRSKTPAAQ